MEIQLISGRFSTEDAEALLQAIFNVKINFHEEKIKELRQLEEDIAHSEKRIQQLQETLRKTIAKLKEGGNKMIDINAVIDISLAPRLA